jgi:hypothetical protein
MPPGRGELIDLISWAGSVSKRYLKAGGSIVRVIGVSHGGIWEILPDRAITGPASASSRHRPV